MKQKFTKPGLIKSIHGGGERPPPIAERSNALLYLEHLAGSSTKVATLLVNSGLTGLFASQLKAASVASLKVRLCTLLALLLRHTTYVSAHIARGDLVAVLSAACRDRTSERVRHRATAWG